MTERAKFPHCNSQVLHAPGECVYCDHYPERQRERAAGKTPFTPNEANGWSGNVAVQAGQTHTHMGMTYVAEAADVFLGSKVDGEQAVADLKRGKRGTFLLGAPRRWVPRFRR